MKILFFILSLCLSANLLFSQSLDRGDEVFLEEVEHSRISSSTAPSIFELSKENGELALGQTMHQSILGNSQTSTPNHLNDFRFHETSRNLILLFLALFLTIGSFFIQDYFVQIQENNANLIKIKMQQDLESQTVKALKAKLAKKDRELATFSIALEEKNHMLNRIKGKLNALYNATDTGLQNKLRPISKSIDQNMQGQQDWLLFQNQLSHLHPGFLDHLKKTFPKLSTNDLRLCAYIRMNFTINEIAALLHINPSSVQKARYRLRKKLDLSSKQKLESYFSNFGEQQ